MILRRQRGLTILEIMITMALATVGLAGLFAALSSAVRGASSANHYTQAQARARVVLENMMGAPRNILDCLVANTANNWSACEGTCQAALGAASAAQACMFTTLSVVGLDKDNTGQQYQVVYDVANRVQSSFVQGGGASTRVYELQVTVGWNDGGAASPPTHRLTLHTSVFE